MLKSIAKNTSEIRAIILAGGSGSRLWPLSRKQIPKQFLCLSGTESMLTETIKRVTPPCSIDDVIVVSSR